MAMSERPSPALRNQRKRFVKCVDCNRRMLPQNASRERPWATAAALYVKGRVNDGALCFDCANRRRTLLGAPLERDPAQTEGPSPGCEPALKKVSVNGREYSWEIGALESLMTKWLEERFPEKAKNMDGRLLFVTVNDVVVPGRDFSSTPISDGDKVTIMVGALLAGG
jgi:sulfur carrier protein ThiS